MDRRRYFDIPVLLVLMLAFFAPLSASAADAAKECANVDLLRVKAGDAKSVAAGLQYEIGMTLYNPKKADAGKVKIWAEGAKLAESGKFETPGLKAKEKVDVKITATIGPLAAKGEKVAIKVVAEGADGCRVTRELTLEYLEYTGTMFFIPGFHYDPEWWNTQQHYLESYDRDNGKREVFFLINAYLDAAAKDKDYRFMLAEEDYLKPFSIVFPERVAEMRSLISEGRLELGGLSYNEPQETLISTESLIRNTVLGMEFKKDLGGKIGNYAWQLDVFGHSPLYPMVIKGVGGEASAWARGPYHEWAPPRNTQNIPSEFYWVSPDGSELLTHFMSGHYSYGWFEMSPYRGGGYDHIKKIFDDLGKTSLTGHILVPMVDDFALPVEEMGEWTRKWNKENLHPSMLTATPGMFFDAVNKSIKDKDIHPPRISRDMNPVFPGCAVSFTDTKQANRQAENTLVSAEKFGAIAGLLDSNYKYPQLSLDKAWRQLAFTSHHDGVTGSESDQVYLDLLGSWREANVIAGAALFDALNAITAHVDTRRPAGLASGIPIVVYNPLSWTRDDMVLLPLELNGDTKITPAIYDAAGKSVESQLSLEGYECQDELKCPRNVYFIARGVPGTGYKVYFLLQKKEGAAEITKVADSGGKPIVVETDMYKASFDPAQGGTMVSLVKKGDGDEFIPEGQRANELVVYHEYPNIPGKGEGPWHFSPDGKKEFSNGRPTILTVEKGPVITKVIAKDAIYPEAGPGTADSFELIDREKTQLRDASNYKSRTFDLTKYIGKSGKVFVKFSDAFNADGWGALGGKVKFTSTKDGKPVEVEFTPDTPAEKDHMALDGGSSVDRAAKRRFADATSYWVYSFDADPGAKATLQIDLGNQYVVEASGSFAEGTTPYYRVQETYFYTGMDRIDFRTYIQGFRGHDRMFRVHFPQQHELMKHISIPVYDVGNAAIGRNFGYDVDTTEEPWTLGNTAYNWVDMSYVLKIYIKDEDGGYLRQDISVGQGEIVIGDSATREEELAADKLVKALAAKGVTMTVTRASKRRCCEIDKDSTNADFRLVIGTVSTNSLVGALFDKLPENKRKAANAEIGKTGNAKIYLPWDSKVAILMINGAGKDYSWIDSVVQEIEKERSISAVDFDESMPPHDSYLTYGSAALINRGTPSYIAYDNKTYRTLALTLMRSSSGWPSGLWLDPPRRKAPVGENFEYENWDHVFWYSLYPHKGTWYEADTTRRGYEFNFPLLTLPAGPHEGELPASGLSFVETEPKDVILSAMKPAGFEKHKSDPDNIIFRVYESDGNNADAKLKFFRAVDGKAQETDYTEEKVTGPVETNGGEMSLKIGSFHTTTVSAKFSADRKVGAASSTEGMWKQQPEKDMLGAAYSRYWRNNVGAAPMGNLPVSVTIRPDKIQLGPDDRKMKIDVVVSNAANTERATGTVKIAVPTGTTYLGELNYDIEPGGYKVLPLALTMMAKEPPHDFFIRASVDDPLVKGQEVYDIAKVSQRREGEVSVSLAGKWDFAMNPRDWKPGQKKRGAWQKIKLPGYWEDQFPAFDGIGIYRRELDVPDTAGIPLELDFTKGADDGAEVYLNGERICPDALISPNFRFKCGLGTIKPGKYLLEVSVNDKGGTGGINGDVILQTVARDNMFDVELLTPKVEVAPGGGKVVVKYSVKNHADVAVHGTVLLIAPPEAWGWMPSTIEFDVAQRGQTEVQAPLFVTGGAGLHSTWMLGKFMIEGELIYSDAAEIKAKEKK